MVLITKIFPSLVWKIAIAVVLLRSLPAVKDYSIAVKTFKDAVTKASASEGSASIDSLVQALRRSNGRLIPTRLDWIPFSAGGLQLRTKVIYPGIMESVVAFEALAPTSGRGGFHLANSSCAVFSGSVTRYNDYSLNAAASKETIAKGQSFRQGEFDSYQYVVEPGTYVACYSRGVIPLSAVWPVTGSLANGDPVPIFRLGTHYAVAYFDYIKFAAKSLWNTYTPKDYHSEL